jgi:diguanylate cyclase (GGDEF)-like protein
VSGAPPDDLLRGALHAVGQTLRAGLRPDLPPELAEEPELERIVSELLSLYHFVLALSNGDLEQTIDIRGNVAGALKSLQASLRHLTWQSQRVAAGDFTQRVDFMGEFADAFNVMVESLDRMRSELDERNEQLVAQALKLEELATTDALTGVFNRRKFNELIRVEIERVNRYGKPLSFVILDIDLFKRVNDTLGHEAGDHVLVLLAALIDGCIRNVDSLARWGGEEFVILLPQVDLRGAVELAERVRDAVGGRRPTLGVTISCGVAEYQPPETADSLFARADRALYRAKDLGRDRVEAAD